MSTPAIAPLSEGQRKEIENAFFDAIVGPFTLFEILKASHDEAFQGVGELGDMLHGVVSERFSAKLASLGQDADAPLSLAKGVRS